MASIEIDGKVFEVENGKTIIEVADEAGIYIPRFCYHKKLSVAANCRMCLVEVENNRKTVPACATPITNGMKVFTKSKEALRSQQAVMEFLLINHPLDCPICDQGGECELQDLSMGFGSDSSAYGETKRTVNDDDLGALIATDMTRCIHCTRCVRFSEEIAGLRELGATGRGEHMQIGTYIKHALKSELSANIIDLCPVGALTSKPYRFKARAWELEQHEGLAVHDCIGSHVYLHIRRNELMRVVPKECDLINETWLSDRDRFSYLGLNDAARARTPMIKRQGHWESVDWPTALQFAVDGMNNIINQYGSEQLAAFSTPSATLEEQYLLQKMMRALGVNNLDHRLHQSDFRDQSSQPLMPTNSITYAELERQNTLVLLGCNIDKEVPLASVRIRKAYLNDAKIYAINSVDYDYRFEICEKIIISPQYIPLQLAKIALALAKDRNKLPQAAQRLLVNIIPDAQSIIIAQALSGPAAVIISGAICENHPDAALLRTLIGLIAKLSGASTLRFTTGSNSAGACLAGMLPHRTVAGAISPVLGMDIEQALAAKLKAYFLMGIEAEFDFVNPCRARRAMLGAEFVVILSSYQNDAMHDYANVILPMAPYAETSGTYINLDQSWQSVKGALAPYGEARPAWKILRVLANLCQLAGFEYNSTAEVLAEIKFLVDKTEFNLSAPFYPESMPLISAELMRVGEWPLYRSDAIVRHAVALQDCTTAEIACIRMHPDTADLMRLDDVATVSQGDIEITLPLQRDERIAPNVAWVANALPETIDLGHAFAAIKVRSI